MSKNNFRDIAYKAVLYSKSINKYFVSDALRVDSGLACLFGFENELIGAFDNRILCSAKFIRDIQEDWWERDWVHIGNLQCTGIEDKNGVEICEGDIVKVRHFLDERKRINAEIKFSDCAFIIDMVDMESYLTNEREYIEVIGNVYENPELLEDSK